MDQSDAVYWFDILLVKPRIMFLDNSGIYETSRKECAKNYIKNGDFKVDIISVLPFEVIYVLLGRAVIRCPFVKNHLSS